MVDRITATVWDAIGSVCADLTGLRFVYAAGVTASVLYETDLVVPQADEFVDSGLPCVIVGLGPWSVIPGHAERRTYEFQLAVCHARQPLGEVIPLMADHIDELLEGFEDHSKAKLHAVTPDWNLGSSLITGGRGIEPRELRAGVEQPARPFLVAPLTVEAKVNRNASYQPA